MKLTLISSVFLVNALVVDAAKTNTRALFLGFGKGRKGGKGGKGIAHFCQKLSESEAGECPTQNIGCPERAICKEDESNGSLNTFCNNIEAVEDCNVDTATCLEILDSCGCTGDVDCTSVISGPGGKGSKIGRFCQKISESGGGTCPTPDGLCPERPICKPDGANGSLSLFCDDIEAVEGCDVDTATCLSSLSACGCADTVDCTNVGASGPIGGSVSRRGGGGPGRLNRMCQKLLEHSESGSTECPTRNGSCPTRAICVEGDGLTSTFCGTIDSLQDCALSAAQCVTIMDNCGCNDEEIDCDSLEWVGPGGM